MRIILDTREPALLDKCTALNTSIPIIVKSLDLGDAIIQNESGHDIILFERKSLQDLLASIKDGRYEEQSHRLLNASGLHPHNIVYILEGAIAQLRNPADKKIVLSAITSLSYFKGFSVFRTASLQETAELVCSIAAKINKDYEKGKPVPVYSYPGTPAPAETDSIPVSSEPNYSAFVKKVKHENITPQNIGDILLCQIPGISSVSAKEIMKCFGGSFCQLITELKTCPEKLDTIYLEGDKGKRRKLGANIIKNLKLYLGETPDIIPT
jgi:ERCC4-type nuclease